MQRLKRVVSMILCVAMMLSVLPLAAFAADTTPKTPVDAAIIFSDLHTNSSDYKESTVKGVMNALKASGLPFSSVTSAGDAFSVNSDYTNNANGQNTGYTSTITGYIQSVLGTGMPVNYVWSDHDRYAVQADGATLLDNDSGLIYGAGADGEYGTADDGNYYIYELSMADMSTNNRYSADFHSDAEVTANIAAFKAAAAGLDKSKPLLIASHMPLFDRRDDNGHALEWATAINQVAETMDVAYFFGHNHSYDEASDYYYAKGSTMPVAKSDLSSENVKLNFTHLCAGYLAPSSTGSTSVTTREGTAMAVVIYEDEIAFTTYNADGVYTGNYAVNETVDREFAAATTTPEDPTEEPTEAALEWTQISTKQDKTIFRLTNSLTAGKKYVIVSSNTAGDAKAVNLTGSSYNVSIGSTDVTVIADAAGNYIEAPAATAQWTYNSSRFENVNTSGRYLRGNSNALGTTTSTSSSYITWSYSSDSYGLLARQNSSHGSYRYMTSVTTTSSTSSNTNRVYIYEETTIKTDELWAAMAGKTSFTFPVNGYNEQTIRDAITVYTASAADGTGKEKTDGYTLDGTVNGSTAGTYTLKVKYNGVEVGTISVSVSSDPYLQITENDVAVDSITRTNVEAGDKIQLGVKAFNGVNDETNPDIHWSIADEDAGKAIVDDSGLVTIQDNNCHFMVHASWTVNGETVTDYIQIGVSPDNYLTPNVSTNDFPQYPNPGAIRYDKTAEAVGTFSKTGVAQMELSMTGIPFSAPKAMDVVLMLDHSNSMTESRMAATRAAVEVFVNNVVKNADGSFNGNRIYIASFAGGNPEYAGQPRHEFRLYKMTTNEEDGFQIVSDQKELDALIAQINSTYVKFSSSTAPYGTEYDQSLEDCYNVLKAVKDDGHQQFCVFMSDGIPNVYRYGAGENDKTTSSSAMANLFTPTSGTTGTRYTSRGTNYRYEYWSSLMKQEGVTVFSVGLGLNGTNSSLSGADADECECVSNMLLNDISGAAGETADQRDTGDNISKLNKYFFSVDDANAAEDMENVFTNIASQIMMAATDIVVTDKITEEYTMIFGIPKTHVADEDAATRNKNVAEALENQELYIEVVNYDLDAAHERTGTKETLTRIYLADSNGATAGGTYSAATDASGTAAAAPVFTAKAGDRPGYWFQVSASYAVNANDIVINVNGTYWKFMQRGDGTHNMTAGAYAYGTISAETNMSEDLVIVTPYFAYSAKTRMLAWTADKVEEFKELALRYFLYLNDSSTEIGTDDETNPGTYPTNEWAYMTYTNHLGNDCRQKFPEPKMTWNGAQVSYVFYLVNSEGHPINKAGEEVDFANATFITDIFTHYVVWNDTDTPTVDVDGEGVAYLDAEWFASSKLPEGYTLFDNAAYYELKVYEDHQGNVLDNYFKIDGSEAGGNTASTTKVYNIKAGTKYSAYGTYKENNVVSGFDFSHTTVAFAVVWEQKLNPDTVVVDYGLDVLVNVVENDMLSNALTCISKTARNDILENTGTSTNSSFTAQEAEEAGYIFTVESDKLIRFRQKNMQFNVPAKIYYETKCINYFEGVSRTEYMFSTLTVIPATTIYYEDNFVALEVYKESDDTLATDQAWQTVGTVTSAVQDQDRPGESKISADLDADNVYGYDSHYTSMSAYSMGTARKLNVNSQYYGKARFSFCGTGFDVISLTSNRTGTIVVQVVNSAGETVRSKVVDTYYSYTKNAEGQWVISNDAENALYQVPVITVEDLPYGTYNVVITAAYNAFFDHNTTDNGYDLYLDAIRVYNPTGNQNAEANSAYVADGEGWPIYKELRDLIISDPTNAFGDDVTVNSGTDTATTPVAGVVFIDTDAETGNLELQKYVSYGPNNELYLAPGQSIAFNIADAFVKTGTQNSIDPVDIQLAVKTVGGSAKIEIFNPGISVTTENNEKKVSSTKENLIAKTLNSATDLYYSIHDPDNDPKTNDGLTGGIIVISNSGTEGIISITNLKFTFAEAASVKTVTTTNEETGEETVSEASVASIDEAGAVFAMRSLRAYSVSEPVETEPEVTEPETEVTEPETTEPETEATEPETTEPETEETVPETTEPGNGGSMVGTVIRVIKKLIGWIFG